MTARVIRLSASLADDMASAITGFLNYCRSKNLSENTMIYYRDRLSAFQRFCEAQGALVAPKDATPQLLREFLIRESQERSPSTADHSFITLRTFFNFLVDDGFLSETPLRGVDKLKQRRTVIQTFTQDHIQLLVTACDHDFVGQRDRAMISHSWLH